MSREARANAFLQAMRTHDTKVANAGYCGGCEVCGSIEESFYCASCGWDQDVDGRYDCPTWDAAWHGFVATMGAEPTQDEINYGYLIHGSSVCR